MDKIELHGAKDYIKYYALRIFVIFIYIVSHLYDYICYPIFFIIYHPWLVRQYKKDVHARTEVRDDCLIFHSVEALSAINVELEKNKLETMDDVFRHVTKKYGSRDALGTREILSEEDEVQPNGRVFKKYVLGRYKWRSFNDFEEEATKLSAGLLSLGLKSKDKVAMIAETRAEWLITAYACFKNNMSIVTIYTNLGNDGIIHAMTETEASVAFCSHDTLKKLASVSSRCPHLKHAVVMRAQLKTQFDGSTMAPGIQVQTFESVMNLRIFLTDTGPSGDDGHVIPESESPSPSDIAIIMYTSGSTGKPKGVMLSHENIIASMSSLLNIANFKPRDRYIGYLPLAHVLELLAETSCLLYGIKIGYSSPLTLTNKSSKVKAGSKGDANLLKPTLMCAVPLIIERIYKSIVDTMRRQGWAAEELFHYFVRYKIKWQDRGFDTPLLNKTLFRKIRYFLGGRVRLMLSGSAPAVRGYPFDRQNLYLCPSPSGIRIDRNYRLRNSNIDECDTDTYSPSRNFRRHDRKTGRVGAPVLHIKIKLVNWEEGNYLITDKPNPRGEIHVGGRNVAAGYFKDAQKTSEEFYEEDGVRWFRTGDIGEMTDDGVLRIIDRKKDLVKLQGGEYVSYGKVESVLKTSNLVDNICLYADPAKDYTVAIIVPSISSINETLLEGKEKITAENCNESEKLKDQIVQELDKFGKKNGLEKFELPKKVHLDAVTEWTPDSGHVTAAFKIRRRNVYQDYEKAIKLMYT